MPDQIQCSCETEGESVPTYQYACTECGHAFEEFQSFADDALTECPQCQGRLRKVFNAVGVVFKGSGFYRTDSRGKSSSDGSDAGSSPATADTGTSTKADKADKADSSSGAKTPAAASTASSDSKAAATA